MTIKEIQQLVAQFLISFPNSAAGKVLAIDSAGTGLEWINNVTPNQAPVASSVNITGTAQSGQTLTGSYTYSDTESNAEGTSLKQWYRADDGSGTNRAAISGATGSTYLLGGGDVGKFIQFAVTPVAATGTTTGTQVLSSYTAAVIDIAYQTDVQDYADRVVAQGDTVSTPILTAYNNLVLALQNVGGVNEWAKVKEFSFWGGSTLNGRLVKAKFPAGKPSSLTQNNTVESDFSDGIGLTAGAAQELLTGLPLNTTMNHADMHLMFAGDKMLADPRQFATLIGAGDLACGLFNNGNRDLVGYISQSHESLVPTTNYDNNIGVHIVNADSDSNAVFAANGVIKATNSNTRSAFTSTNTFAILSSNSFRYNIATAWGYTLGTAFLQTNLPAINIAFTTFFAALGRKADTKIYWEGDSLTAAAAGGYVIPTDLLLSGLNKRVGFLGINALAGKTLATIYTDRVATNYQAYVNASNHILVVAGASNDLAQSGTTGTNLWNNTTLPLITYLKSIGITNIVLITVASRSGVLLSVSQSQFDTERGVYNGLVRSNATAQGYSVCDWAASPHIGPDGTVDNTYYVDGTHFSTAGQNEAAIYMKDALLTFM